MNCQIMVKIMVSRGPVGFEAPIAGARYAHFNGPANGPTNGWLLVGPLVGPLFCAHMNFTIVLRTHETRTREFDHYFGPLFDH